MKPPELDPNDEKQEGDEGLSSHGMPDPESDDEGISHPEDSKNVEQDQIVAVKEELADGLGDEQPYKKRRIS